MPPLTHQKILVAEDSLSQRAIISRHLRKWNYDVLEASDGLQALSLFRRESPPIVITDLDMPGIDGFRLTEAIRKSEIFRTFIIVLSASGDKSSVVSSLAMGADDYLVKPYHPEELRVRLSGAERVLLLQNQELLIFAMAQMVDTRSRETGAHLDRVQFFCRKLAEDSVRMKLRCCSVVMVRTLNRAVSAASAAAVAARAPDVAGPDLSGLAALTTVCLRPGIPTTR